MSYPRARALCEKKDVYKRQIEAFLSKRCECIEFLAIKSLSKDNVVHPYSMIVVLTHTITQNPKVAQIYPCLLYTSRCV